MPTCRPNPNSQNDIDLTFSSKDLQFSNLNVRYLVPKLDELRLVMANNKCPDNLGVCETFLESNIEDGRMALQTSQRLRINLEADSSYISVILIETIWLEVTLPNSKPFLVCTIYRPPNAQAEWFVRFEEELSTSIAHTVGLEVTIDFNSYSNRKWINLIQLFDLSQLVSESTRVTQSSATLIDHVYTTDPDNITESFDCHFAISDHFPVCFTRKLNYKISKTKHITTSYRCFKQFNKSASLNDIERDIRTFIPNSPR